MIFEIGVIFETVYVIQYSRNASNETNIKFSIYFGVKFAKNNVPGFSTF